MQQVRYIMATAIVLALGTAATPAQAQSDGEAIFESVFGDRAREVAATREKSDDIELARELTDAARHSSDPDVQRFLITKAYELARRDASGYGVAFEAVDMLEELIPDTRAEATQMRMSLLDTQYRAASREDRPTVALAYLEALQASAEARLADDPESAAADFRKAIPIAAAAGVDRSVHDYLRERITAATDRATVLRRQEQLSLRVRQRPTDRDVREELITLLVVERDDPEAAAVLIDDSVDPALATVVRSLSKSPTRVKGAALRTTSDWLYNQSQAAGVSTVGKRQMLERALAFYEARAAANETDSMASLKVELIRRQLAAMGSAAIEAPEPEADALAAGLEDELAAMGSDVRAIKLFRPLKRDKGVVSGEADVFNASNVSFEGPGTVITPLRAAPPLELSMTLAMEGSSPRVMLALPLGDRPLMIDVDMPRNVIRVANVKPGSRSAGVARVDVDLDAQQREFMLQVSRDRNEQLLVRVFIDGQNVLRWEGPATDLDDARNDLVQRGIAIGMEGGTLKIRGAELRARAIEVME